MDSFWMKVRPGMTGRHAGTAWSAGAVVEMTEAERDAALATGRWERTAKPKAKPKAGAGSEGGGAETGGPESGGPNQ